MNDDDDEYDDDDDDDDVDDDDDDDDNDEDGDMPRPLLGEVLHTDPAQPAQSTHHQVRRVLQTE